jgi:hypothetical protein
MSMKIAIGILALIFATSAFAQVAPPKAGKKPPALAKPQTPMACKLVGTAKGIKIWAGDCTDAGEMRGTAPATEAPSGEKQ